MAAPLRRLCRDARPRLLRRRRVRRGRAPLPAGREVAGRGRQPRRQRRVRRALVLRVLPLRAGPPGERDRGAPARAPRSGFPAADRPGLRSRGREGGGDLPGRDRGAGDRARLPAGPARGARPVGARGGAGHWPVASAGGLRHRDLPRAHGRRGAGGRRAARRLARGHGVAPAGVRVLRAAGRSPLVGHQVRARRNRDRGLRGAVAAAGAAAHPRAGLGRVRSLQRGAVRGGQRGALRRAHPLRGRRARGARDRRRLPARLPRTLLPARRSADRPRLRTAALGAGVRARACRAVAAVPLQARAALTCPAGIAGHGARRHDVRRRSGAPVARGRFPRSHDVRVLVPAPAPAGGAGAGRAADGVGSAPPAAHRRRARGGVCWRLGVALPRRGGGRRGARDPAPGRSTRTAHRAAAVVR